MVKRDKFCSCRVSILLNKVTVVKSYSIAAESKSGLAIYFI